MSLRPVISIGVLCSLGCAATGLPDRPILKDHALVQKVFELKSGLRVVVQEDHNAETITVLSSFGSGATSDPAGVEGLAHFVEHLAFRTKPGGEAQMWDILKRSGGVFNAFTSADETVYFTIAHKERLGELMQLEAWRLARTLDGVTPEVFDIEREVVRNELRQRYETTAGNKLFDAVLEQLYPKGHPLARPLAGTHETLGHATLAHAQEFVAKHYKPDNCTVVISGDINPAEVGKLLGMWPAEILFGPGGPDGVAVPPRKRLAEKPVIPVPNPASTKLVRMKVPVLRPELVIAWAVPGGGRGNDMLIRFTGAALNIALFEGVEQKFKDDLLDIGAFAQPFIDGSIIMITASLKEGADPEKARRRLLDAVVNAWAGELTQSMTLGGKWGSAANLVMSSASPTNAAMMVGAHMTTRGKHQAFKDTLEELSRVETTEVREFAYQYLKRERAVSVFFEPENDEMASVKGSAGGGAAGAKHDIGRGQMSNIAGLDGDAILRVAQPPGLSRLPRWKLGNGLEVVLVHAKNAPVAGVSLRLPGGNASVQPFGLANLATNLATTQCTDHGDLSPVGGFLFERNGSTFTSFEVQTLAGNLVNGLAVLSDQVACVQASEEAYLSVPELLDRRKERLNDVQKRPQYKSQKAFLSALYPGHPYGKVDSDPDELRKVQFPDLAAFVRNHYRPDRAIAVVVGSVTEAELKPMVEKYFARWPAGGAVASEVPALSAGPTERKIMLFNRKGSTQSTVDLGCRLASRTPDTLPAFDLIGNIVEGKTWELRETWGATYGIATLVNPHADGSADLRMSGAVVTAQTGQAVAALLGLVNDLGTTGPDIKSFSVARWDVARGFNLQFASVDGKAGAVMTAAANGWPTEVWDRYPENLANTSRATVKDIVAPCVGKEIVTIVGDEAALRPQLEAAGLTVSESPR
jgi:zinc protease